MSLIRPVIRMCARAALLNNTLAGDRVFDSRNTPMADMLTEDAAPYISIYTDEDTIPEVTGRSLYMESRTLSLTLEIACAKAVEIEGTSPAEFKIEVPATDEGLEFAVDIVHTQMMAALFDPTNQWAELLNKILFRITRVPSQRGGSAQAGTRWAARQVILVCDTIADSPPGVVPEESHPIQEFITLAKADPDMVIAGVLIENVINSTAAADWRQVQAWLGLTKEGIRSTGLAPVVDGDETAAELQQVSLNDLVPLAPVVVVLSSPANPPVFQIGLWNSSSDEHDAQIGDKVQVQVDTQNYISRALTSADIASGSINIIGEMLPDGEHQVIARMQRVPVTRTLLTPVVSAWSDPASFVVS